MVSTAYLFALLFILIIINTFMPIPVMKLRSFSGIVSALSVSKLKKYFKYFNIQIGEIVQFVD